MPICLEILLLSWNRVRIGGFSDLEDFRPTLCSKKETSDVAEKGPCLTKVFLPVFSRNQNSESFDQYRAQFMIGILSINRDYESEVLDQSYLSMCSISIEAHLFF